MDSGSSTSKKPASSRLWLYAELAITVAFLIVAFSSPASPPPPPLLERDLALSYPYVEDVIVPVWLLVLLALGVPAVLILVIAVSAPWNLSLRLSSKRRALSLCLWLLLAWLQAHAATFAATNIIKGVAGRGRPNFFAYCNYHNFRYNQSQYLSHTVAGAIVDLSHCMASASEVTDSHASFPSGHSSTSFAGMVLTVCLLRWVCRLPGIGGSWLSLPGLACASPLGVAAWIALSRVRDRWHNHDDIAVGAAIGTICALCAWAHFAGAAGRNPLAAGGGTAGGAAADEADGEEEEEEEQEQDGSTRKEGYALAEASSTGSSETRLMMSDSLRNR